MNYIYQLLAYPKTQPMTQADYVELMEFKLE